jgi:hypothetical protein
MTTRPPLPEPPPPKPLPRGPWVARLVSLLLAAVSIPYCLVVVLLVRQGLPPTALSVLAVAAVVAFLPPVVRAYLLASGAMNEVPPTFAARFESWLGAISVTVSVLLAAHLVFFCVCFPSGLLTLPVTMTNPSNWSIVDWLIAGLPWVAGIMFASWAAYWLTGRILQRSANASR